MFKWMIDAKIQQLTCLNDSKRVKDHLNLKPKLKHCCSIILAQFLSKKRKILSRNKSDIFPFFGQHLV